MRVLDKKRREAQRSTIMGQGDAPSGSCLARDCQKGIADDRRLRREADQPAHAKYANTRSLIVDASAQGTRAAVCQAGDGDHLASATAFAGRAVTHRARKSAFPL